MSFRERIAWATLSALLLVFLLFLFNLPSLHQPYRGGRMLHLIGSCAVLFLVIEFVAWLFLRLRTPGARNPKDELERMIELKSRRIGAWVYVGGSFVAIFVSVHLVGAGPGALGTAVLVAFVIAEIVNYAARIVYYRRTA